MEELLRQLLNEVKEMRSDIDDVKIGQVRLEQRMDNFEKRMDNLEQGQQEVKEMIKHNTTLTIESLTDMRKDIKQEMYEVKSDINLLFEENSGIKRKIARIEQRLNN